MCVCTSIHKFRFILSPYLRPLRNHDEIMWDVGSVHVLRISTISLFLGTKWDTQQREGRYETVLGCKQNVFPFHPISKIVLMTTAENNMEWIDALGKMKATATSAANLYGWSWGSSFPWSLQPSSPHLGGLKIRLQLCLESARIAGNQCGALQLRLGFQRQK